MSMRGIDAQLLITRTAESTKEAGRAQRSHDVNQEQLAERARAEDRRKQERVQGARETEATRISERRQGQDGGRGKQREDDRGKPGKESGDSGKNAAPEHTIDIKI